MTGYYPAGLTGNEDHFTGNFTCEWCGKYIREQDPLGEDGQWCQDCAVVCAKCDTTILEQDSITVDGKPFCETCEGANGD